MPMPCDSKRGDRGVRLRFAREWAATHPRTLYLLQQEAQAWDRSGVLELALDGAPGRTTSIGLTQACGETLQAVAVEHAHLVAVAPRSGRAAINWRI